MVLFDDIPTAGIPMSALTIERKAKPAQSARIVFEDNEAVEKALNMDLEDVLLPYEKGSSIMGMKRMYIMCVAMCVIVYMNI